MSAPPVAAIEGEVLPDVLHVPDEVIAELRLDVETAAANAAKILPEQTIPDANVAQEAAILDREHWSAVKRLQDTLGTKSQSVKAQVRYNEILALTRAGHSIRKIAEMKGLKQNTVKQVIFRARRSRVLNDLREILEHETTALAVDTVNHHLKKKNADVAVEHLKGMGLYKNHSNVKNDGGGAGFQMPPLQVNVVVQNVAELAKRPESFDYSEGAVGVPREDA